MNLVLTASIITAVYIICVYVWYRKRFPKSRHQKRGSLLEEDSCYDCPDWAENEKWEESLR